MASKSQNLEKQNLIVWHPAPTHLPIEWVNFSQALAEQAKGSLHPLVLKERYDAKGVGELLHSWGLPWTIVIAGYLWEYDKEQIVKSNLPAADQIISHIEESKNYYHYIEIENLPPLLTPPYRDLGALLLAIAIYFQALQAQNKTQAYPSPLQSDIDRIGKTLLNVIKLLGVWSFKRKIEDMLEELRHPQWFAEAKQERQRILEQDKEQLERIKDLLKTFYQETTQQPIEITYTACGIAGMERRKQDAHTTATSQKTQLTGFDLVTFDVILPTVRDCYEALGVLSQLGYIQDRVTDQIANPKPNGYSHIAFGLILKPRGETPLHVCQLQIATRLMQAIGSYGCLHPQCYELFIQKSEGEQRNYLLPALAWHSEEGNVLQAIKEGLRLNRVQTAPEDPIVVYDKGRRPIALPKGATALDFAFKIDSITGERAVEAFINNRKAPINRALEAGDIIEIRTSNQIQAREYWLEENYTKTTQARRLIKVFLDQQSADHKAYNLLSQELERHHYMLPLDELNRELSLMVEQYNLGTVSGYLQSLAGAQEEPPYTLSWAAQTLIRQIIQRHEYAQIEQGGFSWIPTPDIQLMSHSITFRQQRLCRFCNPSYPHNMRLKGRLHPRRGELVVHKEGCPYLIERIDHQSIFVPMIWQRIANVIRVAFFVAAQDHKGLVHDLTKQIRSQQCDLVSLQAEAIDKLSEAHIHFTVEAHEEKEILDLWGNLYELRNVRSVELNAAATHKNVHDRLQQLRAKSEPLAETTTVHSDWDKLLESLRPRNSMLKNPYDISRPASTKMFYGRDTEIKTMQRELCEGENGRAVILYGPRRSGKSSICKNFLERQIRPDVWGVHCSLQNTTQKTEEGILMQLADEITTAFHEQMQGAAAAWHHYHDSDPQIRFKKIIQACADQAPNSRLLLALDEFGGALESHKQNILEFRFFSLWKDLLYGIPQLSLIFALPTSSHKSLTTGDFSNAFTFATSTPIEFLDTDNAKKLLADPLREQYIAVQPNTISKAVTITGGSPYYMTLLGKQIIDALNVETTKTVIADEDLYYIIEDFIADRSNPNFAFHNRELQNVEELKVLEAIIEITNHSKQPKVQMKKIAAWLDFPESITRQHLDRLRNGLILQEYGNSFNPYYAFKIELVRLWLKNNRWFFSSLT